MNQPMEDDPPDLVLSSRGRVPAGRFRMDVVTERWWWSDQTYRIHGYEPLEVTPTSATFFAHSHPDDREHLRSVLEDARLTDRPFASTYRIVDAGGLERVVLIVGKRDDDGVVVALDGYLTDLTRSLETSHPR